MRRLSDAPRLLVLLALARAFNRPLRRRSWAPGAQAESLEATGPRRRVAKAATSARAAAASIRGGVGDVVGAAAARLPGRRKGPLRVALLVEPTPFTHVSGYANRFKEQLKYLKEFGDEVAVATPDDKAEAPSEFLGYPITTLEGFRFPLYAHLCLTGDFKGKARKMVEEFKPDVIHASSPGFFALAATAIAKALDVPLVLSYHTHLPVYAERYAAWLPFSRSSAWLAIKAAHAFADVTLVTSPQIMEEFKEHHIRNVKVWQKGIDVEVFNPDFRDAETRNVLAPQNSEKTILLYVGRISVEKRLEDVAEVLRTRPETVFSIVGGGPHEADLRKYFSEFGDRVHFCGVLRGDELSKAYASADMFCMPSDSETLGFVVIEAMASGLPIVAADAGGIPSIVAHESNGILVKPGDTTAFAQACGRFLNDAAMRERLTTRGRQDAEGWSWRAATKNLREEHYYSAIRRHAALKRERENGPGGVLSRFWPRRMRLWTGQLRRSVSFLFLKFYALAAWVPLRGMSAG